LIDKVPGASSGADRSEAELGVDADRAEAGVETESDA
jgi:hypothetical protein